MSARQPASPGKIESTALAQRKASAGETLYETLDPKAIGIDFLHVWTRRPGQLRNNTTGCGVAMGDYDGDGLVDVFLPRSTDGGRLYRNLGGFRFEDVTKEAGILDGPERWTTGATFVDVDNDGDLDLYVCGFDCPNHLYINEGEGEFVERAADYGLDYAGSSAMAAFADHDRDGDLDLYLMTNHIPPDEEIEYQIAFDRQGVPRVPARYLQYHDTIRMPDGSYGVIESGQYDHFYRNDGKQFVDVTEEVGIDGNHKGLGVVWWDYDNDGWPDVYVANDFYGPDRLYHNNRDGTFTDVAPQALPHTPWFSMGCDYGDLNNDGLFDLVGTDMAADTHLRANVTMGDIDNEGWVMKMAKPHQYMRNAVFLGTGRRRVLEAAYITGLAATNWTWSVRMVDLDQDGLADVHVTNGMSRDWGNRDQVLKAQQLGPMNSDAYNRYWDDAPPLEERNFAFRNLGDLKLENVAGQWGLDHVGVAFGAAFGDLDGDGDLDLVINNFNDMVTVARNDGHEGAAIKVRLVGVESNRWGVGATVRVRCGDQLQARYLSLARGFMSASDPTVHFGLGDASVIDELTVEWPSGHEQSFTGLEANRFYKITEPAGPAPAIEPETPETLFAESDVMPTLKHRERAYDDFERQPLLPKRLSQLGPGLACGDVDGDGRDDLFLGGAKGEWGSIVLNKGDGEWTHHWRDLFPPWSDDKGAREDLTALWLDVDGDGDSDLYVMSGSVECEPSDESLRDALYLNDGEGNFSKAADNQLPDLRDSGGAVAAADYDRDGDLDLFVGSRSVPGRYPEAPSSRLLKNEGGVFLDATETAADNLLQTGLVTGALWSDVDGDGWIDLLVTHAWGPIKLFRNEEGVLRDATAEAGLGERHGWWNGIAGRDLDGDGDIDYVATNRGMNTEYRPTQEHPVRLVYGDFGATGEKVLVEGAYDEQGRLVPTCSKKEITVALPFVEAAYPTFTEYASATLEEILGADAMEAALKRKVTTAESVVLRNDGSGRFTFEPLPTAVQLSPGAGVVLSDFNGDGLTDCCIAQNCFAPRREIGNWDGGVSVLLLGEQDGSLCAVPPAQSGILVPGDAQGMAAVDVNDDRWPDVVVGVNSEPVKVFVNNAAGEARLATVRLTGAAGNPTAIGARVTLLRDDGRRQTAEVHAGGGYLSQQPARLHFGLGREAAVEQIEVRWPDGEVTRHTPGGDELDFVIAR